MQFFGQPHATHRRFQRVTFLEMESLRVSTLHGPKSNNSQTTLKSAVTRNRERQRGDNSPVLEYNTIIWRDERDTGFCRPPAIWLVPTAHGQQSAGSSRPRFWASLSAASAIETQGKPPKSNRNRHRMRNIECQLQSISRRGCRRRKASRDTYPLIFGAAHDTLLGKH